MVVPGESLVTRVVPPASNGALPGVVWPRAGPPSSPGHGLGQYPFDPSVDSIADLSLDPSVDLSLDSSVVIADILAETGER
jgi:hypothetical protein